SVAWSPDERAGETDPLRQTIVRARDGSHLRLRRADAVPDRVHRDPHPVTKRWHDHPSRRGGWCRSLKAAPEEGKEPFQIDARRRAIEGAEAHGPITVEDERGRIGDAALLLAAEEPPRRHDLASRIAEQRKAQPELLGEGV